MSPRTTVAPAAEKRCATARPIPDAAPVTTAIFPFSSNIAPPSLRLHEGRAYPSSGTDCAGSAGAVSLHRRYRNGIDDVRHGAAPAQVVHRLAESLEDGPDRDCFRRSLDSLVRNVAGVEVGEDEDGRPAGDVAVGELQLATLASTAASYWIGPSTLRSGRARERSSVAARTASTSGPRPESRSSRRASRCAARPRTSPLSPPS